MERSCFKGGFRPKAGFTLIELLVAVLIIGILAAVALPQYQKAVMKSRYAKMKPLVSALANAEEVYYLANGQYTADIDLLDVDLPQTPLAVVDTAVGKEYNFDWGIISLVVRTTPRIVARNYLAKLNYARNLVQSEYTYAGLQRCSPVVSDKDSNELGHKICQAELGLAVPLYNNDYYW